MAVVLTFEGFDLDQPNECLIYVNGGNIFADVSTVGSPQTYVPVTVDITPKIVIGTNYVTIYNSAPDPALTKTRNVKIIQNGNVLLDEPTELTYMSGEQHDFFFEVTSPSPPNGPDIPNILLATIPMFVGVGLIIMS